MGPALTESLPLPSLAKPPTGRLVDRVGTSSLSDQGNRQSVSVVRWFWCSQGISAVQGSAVSTGCLV